MYSILRQRKRKVYTFSNPNPVLTLSFYSHGLKQENGMVRSMEKLNCICIWGGLQQVHFKRESMAKAEEAAQRARTDGHHSLLWKDRELSNLWSILQLRANGGQLQYQTNVAAWRWGMFILFKTQIFSFNAQKGYHVPILLWGHIHKSSIYLLTSGYKQDRVF